MKKISIQLDSCRQFYPVLDAQFTPFSLEVEQSLIDEYQAAAIAYFSVLDKFEQLFLIQEGLTPFNNIPIPPHKVL